MVLMSGFVFVGTQPTLLTCKWSDETNKNLSVELVENMLAQNRMEFDQWTVINNQIESWLEQQNNNCKWFLEKGSDNKWSDKLNWLCGCAHIMHISAQPTNLNITVPVTSSSQPVLECRNSVAQQRQIAISNAFATDVCDTEDEVITLSLSFSL